MNDRLECRKERERTKGARAGDSEAERCKMSERDACGGGTVTRLTPAVHQSHLSLSEKGHQVITIYWYPFVSAAFPQIPKDHDSDFPPWQETQPPN